MTNNNNKNKQYTSIAPDQLNKKPTRMNVRQLQEKLDKLQAEYEKIVLELRSLKPRDSRFKVVKEKCDTHLYKLVHDMSGIMCPREMIEKILSLSKDEIKDRADLRDAYKKGRESGLRSLLSWQFETASRGSHAMQIWLGKNYLHQLDKIVNEHSGDVWTELLGELKDSTAQHKKSKEQTKAPKCDKPRQYKVA